jgi:hypothetical protein
MKLIITFFVALIICQVGVMAQSKNAVATSANWKVTFLKANFVTVFSSDKPGIYDITETTNKPTDHVALWFEARALKTNKLHCFATQVLQVKPINVISVALGSPTDLKDKKKFEGIICAAWEVESMMMTQEAKISSDRIVAIVIKPDDQLLKLLREQGVQLTIKRLYDVPDFKIQARF